MPKFENSYILVNEEYVPSMKIRFPFETIFASDPVKIFLPEDSDINVVRAGIDSLRPFLDSSVDLEKNYDLIGVAFNAFVVNMANKNGQVISTDVALSSVDNFKFKPMNIEHKRKNVAGLITGYGFSEYGTDKPLTLDEVKDKKDPFNVVLSGFVWRVVNDEFAAKLEESSDPSSASYLSISTSWEMGFKNFNIAKGSKNLSDATIFSDEGAVEKMKDKLSHFGGSGVDEDGSPLYINLVGEVLPLGIGFTTNPAADVRGVAVANIEDLEKRSVEDASTEDIDISLNSSQTTETLVETNINKNEFNTDSQNIAASENLTLENKENKKMLIRSIKDLSDDSLKQVSATDIKALFEDEIKKASEKFAEEKQVQEKAMAEAEASRLQLENQLEELKKTGELLQAELDKIKSEAEVRAKEELFQNRMSSIDEEFELNDEERQIIGSQIKDLTEGGFENWYKAFEIFAKAKSKKAMAEKMKMEQEKMKEESCASEENEVSASEKNIKDVEKEAVEALEKASASESEIPNNGVVATETLKQKFAKAFNSETVKIQIK